MLSCFLFIQKVPTLSTNGQARGLKFLSVRPSVSLSRTRRILLVLKGLNKSYSHITGFSLILSCLSDRLCPIRIGGPLPEIRRQRREADRLPLFSAEVKWAGDLLPLPIRLHGILLN
jgi:hypothetical protein